MMVLKVGDRAPSFEALTEEGTPTSLKAELAKGEVILYFYPKDETFGCTAEACSFRDSWSEVLATGAVVLGVSSDSVTSHASFKKHHNLPFTLLSDPNGLLGEAYGVKGWLLPPRVTFVIDHSGIIRHVYSSGLAPTRHVAEALSALHRIHEGVLPSPPLSGDKGLA
jgi:peroxiredoxin Q/BCP